MWMKFIENYQFTFNCLSNNNKSRKKMFTKTQLLFVVCCVLLISVRNSGAAQCIQCGTIQFWIIFFRTQSMLEVMTLIKKRSWTVVNRPPPIIQVSVDNNGEYSLCLLDWFVLLFLGEQPNNGTAQPMRPQMGGQAQPNNGK